MFRSIINTFKELRYILSSLCAFVIDNTLYYVFVHLVFGRSSTMGAVLASTLAYIIARLLSSFANFNINYFFVFTRDNSYKSAMGKYYLLAFPQAAVSLVLLDVIIANADFGSDTLKLIVKIFIEAVLFVISYIIQNKWVFVKKRQDKE